jgi:exo-beta-1,3-glucanase (GH17 family)
MQTRPSPPLEFGNAICYSGYRQGQSPVDGTYPTVEQVAEDLRILAPHWRHIRLYDCSRHAEIVLEVIRRDGLNLQVMLGADMRPEESNPGCPWQADFDAETLAENRRANSREIDRLIALADQHASVVSAVSVGNEATVEWTDHLVSVETLIGFVRRIKQSLGQPVTFCENYVPWIGKLEPLAAELDFLSVHTYPVWEYQSVDGALDYTRQNYDQVAHHYPDKPVVITEAGWTTRANGRGIDPENASERFQAQYYRELMRWSRQQRILTYVFEAFDEPWKGSPDPDEPEKHWGLFTVDRRPKLVMREAFPHLRPVV